MNPEKSPPIAERTVSSPNFIGKFALKTTIDKSNTHYGVYNESIVPDEVSKTEKSFHNFLDNQSMHELNVQAFHKEKN